jgi:hypothetical protein
MIKIICYTGGTCGDLLAALIDPTGCKFNNQTVVHTPDRIKLKKPHLFTSNNEKDQYLVDVSEHYKSTPSHDLNYHIDRKHSFIGITVQDKKIANWAAKRFKNLHRPHVWEEMCKACGAQTIDDYSQILIDYSWLVSQYTDTLIKLEDILNGNAIESLEKIGITNVSGNLYRNWLDMQHGLYII